MPLATTTIWAFTPGDNASSLALSPSPKGGESEGEEASSLGAELPLWSVLPFVGILLSIAIFPLVAPKFWHHHFGKVSLFWALLFAIPFLIAYQGEAVHEILHIYFKDYIPFIILLWSLFTVAGGILISGAPVGTPLANLVLLLIGTFLASWIGTTGASMVLIRPIIRMNKYRKSKVHLIIFFIFLVSNIGGSLTPLGDPPLFLGFLHGVPFFWTFNIFTEMALLSGALLLMFFLFDTYMFRKEGWHKKLHLKKHHFEIPRELDEVVLEEEVEIENNNHNVRTEEAKMEIKGLVNLIFLLGVIGGVLFSGLVHLGEVTILGVHMEIQSLVRDAFLILMGLLSLKVTPWEYRKGNDFTWFPIVEVAKLFAGIFMTIIPALAMLQAGVHGQLSFIIEAVKEPWHYFWITGILSSFLDNAPTYLTFLNTALGQFFAGMDPVEAVHKLIEHQEIYLKAISTGAVFFGAMTYIGNAPNFMVKSIAEEQGIKMPSFFGYMMYSILLLVPLFIVITFIFF
ncbi:MAG: sodium:proton antiporter [Calditrichaeota bacterium]|nr:sodium:proton antiporter [Calditrichota bacterium]